MGGVLAALAALLSLASPAALPQRIEGGPSLQGRPIVAVRRGSAGAPVRVLVTGSTHGTEPAGLAVVRRLRRLAPPAGVQVWTVRTVNPDGLARGTRQNARGVDLNRNFPYRWRAAGRPFVPYFPGRAAASEPETRALMRIARRVRPQLSIHFHQALGLVDLTGGAVPATVRAYARATGLPAERLPAYRGTASSWENHALPGSSAFAVELPAGALTPRGVQRHARAVLGVAASLLPPAAVAAAAPEPPIRWSPIPFGARRRRETRAYARRHYGIDTARLRAPK